TGRFEGKLHFGENKKKEALSFLRERGITPEECAFYSDSIHDRPLLEAVGTPVAVNPDIRLKELACQRGWRIIYFR
ncbi:MAG: HAD-IB family hydrolase, partial [Spirochaetales bacterium]|nr:HAD-IB family hydrolase [Spirochaetales bacterium]